MMLYPQMNQYRQCIDLSGFWRFRFDHDDVGQAESWSHGIPESRPIAVPASWNEQFACHRDYMGIAWYQIDFYRPLTTRDARIYLRFNSVNYLADVWLNGLHIGSHEGGYLPFVFDISDIVQLETNCLVVRVDGGIAPDRVPPGNLADTADANLFGQSSYPATNYDFFPYRGIDRPVLLYTTPHDHIDDITVRTDIHEATGIVHVDVGTIQTNQTGTVRATLTGHGANIVSSQTVTDTSQMVLQVEDAAIWSPQNPDLYLLKIELLQDDAEIDCYQLKIGIRTVSIAGEKLLLNGEPIKLLGFGRHEDFYVVGKGLLPPLIVRDHALMAWIGANSYRTSHYPYSEQQMDMADELGFLVIDETPAVGLYFQGDDVDRRNTLCDQFIRELIDRDKNHPSVIMWSIANEPRSADASQIARIIETGIVPEDVSNPIAVDVFRQQTELVRSLDPTRLVTLVSDMGLAEEAFTFLDVVCLNRYHGWYTQSGQIEAGAEVLDRELDLLYERFSKPIILAEFGTDTIPGHHAQPAEMFSEEYQADFIEAYVTVLRSKPYVIGQHIWNFADFKTSQGIVRVNGYNYKGIFTRDRRPKLAAHRLRQLWQGHS